MIKKLVLWVCAYLLLPSYLLLSGCSTNKVSGGGASSETENAIAVTLDIRTQAKQSVDVLLLGEEDSLSFQFDSTGTYTMESEFEVLSVEIETGGKVLTQTVPKGETSFAMELDIELSSPSLSVVENDICFGEYECGSLTDSRDGKTYSWILLGKDRWFQENLSFVDATPGIKTFNGEVFYTWNLTADSVGICPAGYSVPTERQWNDFESFAGRRADILVDSSAWDMNAEDVKPDSLQFTNSYGFDMKALGYLDENEEQVEFEVRAFFWTQDTVNDTLAWDRNFSLKDNAFGDHERNKAHALSVRCTRRVAE